MKTKYTMLMALLVVSGIAAAQEMDDMYFNARDRVSHTEASAAVLATRYAAEDQAATKSNPVNPSDTYTGRGVNPEYSAQQKNGAEIVQGNPDYFLSSYKPKAVNSNLNTGSSTAYSGCGCNPYSGFGNPYGSFYSPYGLSSPYGFYSPYSMMGMGAMYTPYGMGSMWSMSMMFGTGFMYGMPYYGMPHYGMYNPYGYYNRYAPIGVTAYDPIQTTYGRRAVRGSTAAQSYAYASPGYSTATGGRTRTTGQSRSTYYDPQWKSDPNNYPTRNYNYSGRTSTYSPSSTGRSSWGSFDNGSRSRSFDSFGSGSRSTGGMSSGGSSSGGGRSRGRN